MTACAEAEPRQFLPLGKVWHPRDLCAKREPREGLALLLRQNNAARTDGTARSPREDSDFGTVEMALGASPPYLLMASVGHILRRERRIAFIVPLCQQVSLFMPGAEIVQRRMDRCSPPAE